MSKAWWADVLLAAAAGAAIWALSPLLVDRAEPWDADSFYYPLSLFVAGVALGALRARRPWAHYLGVFAGQLLYMLLFLPLGGLFVLGLAFLALYSLLTLVGSFAGIATHKLRGRFIGDGRGP